MIKREEYTACEKCAGSGEVAISTSTLNYRAPGPVPEYARGVVGVRCNDCAGTGRDYAVRDQWFNEFRGCLQDMGGSAYDEERVIQKYVNGYSPADAAGEEICEEEE